MLGDTDECERVEAHVAGGSTHPDAPVTIASSDEDIEVTGVCGHFLAVLGTCYSVSKWPLFRQLGHMFGAQRDCH
jgi:hypothetical protein